MADVEREEEWKVKKLGKSKPLAHVGPSGHCQRDVFQFENKLENSGGF